MEYDRYQENRFVYIVGIISLILSMSLFTLTLYIIPYLVFGITYSMPEFIPNWQQYLLNVYEFTNAGASWIIFVVLLSLSLFTALIAFLASNKIDNHLYGIKKTEEEQTKVARQESINLIAKIALIVLTIFIIAGLIQWLTSVPPRNPNVVRY